MSKPVSLKVPATSANLGPGFDALGLAMQLYLQIQAETAETFSIEATGRDAALVGSIERNLMLETYRSVAPHAPALRLRISNAIPLGMGCGSSAAALVAGVLLANHFGKLDLSDQQLVDEASRREGHPDNVAACFHGGLTCSAMQDGQVSAATLGQQLPWRSIGPICSAQPPATASIRTTAAQPVPCSQSSCRSPARSESTRSHSAAPDHPCS
jgi:homoserine kinase